MPCRSYTFRAGPVRFIALDTDEGTTGVWDRLRPSQWFRRRPWSTWQSAWLQQALARPTDAVWTIVYGHHPVFSNGGHGDTTRLHRGAPSLLALLERHRVTAYVAGHDHDLQHIAKPLPRPATSSGGASPSTSGSGPLHFFVVGGGGRGLRPVRCPAGDATCRFADSSRGFLEVDASPQSITYTLRDQNGRCLHREPGSC